jgi:hypothetical protein
MFGRKKEGDLTLSEDKSLIGSDSPRKYYSAEDETVSDCSWPDLTNFTSSK